MLRNALLIGAAWGGAAMLAGCPPVEKPQIPSELPPAAGIVLRGQGGNGFEYPVEPGATTRPATSSQDGQPTLGETLESYARSLADGESAIVSIEVVKPEKAPWREIAPLIVECGRAGIRELRLNDHPVSLPQLGSSELDKPLPADPYFRSSYKLRFEPVLVAGPADVEKLRGRLVEFPRTKVKLRCGGDTPVSLLLTVIKVLHESRTTFYFSNVIPSGGSIEVICLEWATVGK